MRAYSIRALALVAAAMAVGPAGVLAHTGHGGPHPWLAGASQPLLGPDHLTAALFVGALCVVVAFGVSRVRRSHLASGRAERDVA